MAPKSRELAILNKNNREVSEKALRIIEEEELRRLQDKLYQLDPMAWLEDRLGEDRKDFMWSLRPKYKKHKWDGSKDPLANAWISLAKNKWVGIEAATGTSKTYMLSRIVMWFLDVFKDGLVVTSAPKEAQLKLHLWAELQKVHYKFKKIRPKSNMYSLRLVVEDTDGNTSEFDPDNPDLSKSWHAIGFVAGVGSEEASATKAQGFHRKHMLIIVEETPGMPHAVMTAFKNTCTGGTNLICAVGNPDSQSDALHQFCILPQVRHFRVSAYDYPNIVEKEEIIPGAVTIKSIDDRRVEMGENSSLFKSRVRGLSPAQSTDSLIQLEWLEQCRDNKKPYDGNYHAAGVDVANSKDGDMAATAFGTGNILRELKEFQCENANHLAYNLIRSNEDLDANGTTNYYIPKLQDYQIMPGMVGVDAVGVGIATVNVLMDEGWNPVSLQGGQWDECIPEETYIDPYDDYKQKTRKKWKFQGLRSQMYWEFREDVRLGNIVFDTEDLVQLKQLFDELINIKVIYKDSFIAVESKENIKKRLGGKSPNKADAVVYWNWTRKGYRLSSGFMPIIGGRL